MNLRMQNRRKNYLYQKRTFLFRIVICIAMIVIAVQGVKILHGYVTTKGIYDIYFDVPQQELTQQVIEELKKIKGLTGFYPIYTMEAEITVQSYTAMILLKGIDFENFPVKLAELNQDALNGKEQLLVIGTEALSGLIDANELVITAYQKEKLLKDWEEMSIAVAYGGENDTKERVIGGRIAGILDGESQDIFISENKLRLMMEESGAEIMLKNGMIQVDGLEQAANAEQVLQDAGFTVEMEWDEAFKEYKSHMQRNGADLVTACCFLGLAILAWQTSFR